MRFWLVGTLRQWQQHRFVTLLLILGYGLGIGMGALVFAAIAGRMTFERALAIGDPARIVEVNVDPGGGPHTGEFPLETDAWLKELPIDWGYAVLYDKGAAFGPEFTGRSVLAFVGNGPLDWQPPLRSGRFLTIDDLKSGRKVILAGERFTADAPGYEVVGVPYDIAGQERGWNSFLYLPATALPPALRAESGNRVQLHLQVARGADLQQIKATLTERLTDRFPGMSVQAQSVDDLRQQGDRQYRGAFLQGFGFTALLLGFVAANVGTLSIHWVMQRRRELAVRVALGARLASVVGMIIFEQLSMAVTGLLLAVPVIWLGTVIGPKVDLPITLSTAVLLMTVGSAFAAGLLSALLPLRAILRTPLRDSLRYQD